MLEDKIAEKICIMTGRPHKARNKNKLHKCWYDFHYLFIFIRNPRQFVLHSIQYSKTFTVTDSATRRVYFRMEKASPRPTDQAESNIR